MSSRTVDAHATTGLPPDFRNLEPEGNALEPNASAAPARVFRLGAVAGDAAPADVAATDATLSARVDSHAGRGTPDPRRGHLAELTPAELAPAVEDFTNRTLEAVVVENPEAAPDRPRQGWTGADPTRAARYTRPILLRLFDKFAAEHANQTDKAYMPAPLATTPKSLGDVPGAEPYAGGATGTQSQGITTNPNSFRMLPRAWDALLVNTGGPAATAAMPDPAQAAAAGQISRGRFR